MRRARVLVAVLALALPGAPGCRSRAAREEASGTAPKAAALPQLVLRDDTADLLLTWVDAKGNAHTVVTVGEVPIEGRDQVRVVVTSREEGTGDLVWVANLTTKNGDGTYPVTSRTRGEWEGVLAERRAKAAPPPPPAPSAPGAPGSARIPAGTQVIVYGAEWCGPCHQVMAWLKGHGVPAVEKDIEADPGAAREMQEKLVRAGLRGGSIPVVDVRGKILVGFDERALSRALTAGATQL